MAVTGGSNIIRRSLSYGYDTSYGIDTSTISSRYYAGEPTSNLYSNPLFTNGTTSWQFGSWDGNVSYTTETLEGPYGEPITALKLTKNATSAYSHFHQGHGGYYTSGNTYTLSAWVKGYGTFSGRAQWGGVTNFSLNGEWQYVTYSSTTNSNTLYPYWAAENLTTGTTFYMTYAQSEQKPYDTPFINGTRSAFQSIYDLSDRSALNAGTVSYNSTGQPVFDGTDDYIGATGTQYTTGQPWTADMVINPSDITDGYWNAIFGGGLGNGGYFMFHGNGSLTYYEGVIAGSTKIKYFGKYLGSAFPQDTYTHLTVRYNGNSTYDIFINNDKSNHSYIFGSIYSMRLDSVGGAGGRYGSVQIPVFKFYEAALTDQEIEQNYLSYKNRFNL